MSLDSNETRFADIAWKGQPIGLEYRWVGAAGSAWPVLAVQGEDDEHGTLEQIDGIARLAPHARALAIADCGRSPERDQPAVLSREVAAFIKKRSETGS